MQMQRFNISKSVGGESIYTYTLFLRVGETTVRNSVRV